MAKGYVTPEMMRSEEGRQLPGQHPSEKIYLFQTHGVNIILLSPAPALLAGGVRAAPLSP